MIHDYPTFSSAHWIVDLLFFFLSYFFGRRCLAAMGMNPFWASKVKSQSSERPKRKTAGTRLNSCSRNGNNLKIRILSCSMSASTEGSGDGSRASTGLYKPKISENPFPKRLWLLQPLRFQQKDTKGANCDDLHFLLKTTQQCPIELHAGMGILFRERRSNVSRSSSLSQENNGISSWLSWARDTLRIIMLDYVLSCAYCELAPMVEERSPLNYDSSGMAIPGYQWCLLDG